MQGKDRLDFPAMAQPARKAPVRRPSPAAQEAPPIDPATIDRAYRFHRAKRRARLERTRDTRWARLRYLAVLVSLLVLTAVLAVTIWEQVRSLFGL